LVDTLSDEAKSGEPLLQLMDDIDFDDNNEEEDWMGAMGGVIDLLKRRHNCHRYVSTLNRAQTIVREEGVLFGPRKADGYRQEKERELEQGRNKRQGMTWITPPDHFGPSTVQTLLDQNIVVASSSTPKVMVRGWALKDFWEFTSWPRDTEGGSNMRFGFPVVDDLDVAALRKLQDDEDDEPSLQPQPQPSASSTGTRVMKAATTPMKNPFVTEFEGVDGLYNHIVSSKKDCVLFLSAPYCRTCLTLTPAYTRMARIMTEQQKTQDNNHTVLFAKADAGGRKGKELGNALNINAVPTFLMFRAGERYGTPLSISKLPSKRLDLAVQYLTSGMEWDPKAFQQE
jgi:hypothetical protein